MKEHDVVTLMEDVGTHRKGSTVTIVHVHTENPDIVWVECNKCNLVFHVERKILQNIIYL